MKSRDQVRLEEAYRRVRLSENNHENNSHIKSIAVVEDADLECYFHGIPKDQEKFFSASNLREVDFADGIGRLQEYASEVTENAEDSDNIDLDAFWSDIDRAAWGLYNDAPPNTKWFICYTGKSMHLGYEDEHIKARNSLHKQLGDGDELDLKGLFDNI